MRANVSFIQERRQKFRHDMLGIYLNITHVFKTCTNQKFKCINSQENMFIMQYTLFCICGKKERCISILFKIMRHCKQFIPMLMHECMYKQEHHSEDSLYLVLVRFLQREIKDWSQLHQLSLQLYCLLSIPISARPLDQTNVITHTLNNSQSITHSCCMYTHPRGWTYCSGKHVHHGLSTQSPLFPVCVLIRHETILMKSLIKDIKCLKMH